MRPYLPIFTLVAVAPLLQAQTTAPSLGGCSLLPANNVWHARVDTLPVLGQSATYVAALGAASPAHPDFGADQDNGIPYNLVPGNSTPPANVSILWPFTSDSGPFPIPATAEAETPSDPGPSGGDHHLIVVDTDNCLLYEAYEAILTSAATDSWSVDSISRFDLNSNALKPDDWSSSNSAGTTYLPGLIRYDEVAAGHIDHAIAMTAQGLSMTYVWPASRGGHANSGSQYAPMGARFRLKSSVDISGYSANVRVVLEALKTYGAIVIDNGASWFMVGVPDARWDDSDMHNITQLHGSDFEAVDESSLEVSSSSGQVQPGPIPTGWVNIVNQQTGACLATATSGRRMRGKVSASTGGLILQKCSSAAAQKFQFVPNGGSWSAANPVEFISSNGNGYMINAASNGQQIYVPNASTQTGKQLTTAAFQDTANWVWQPVAVGNGAFSLQSLSNGLVIDGNGSSIAQNSYTSSPTQLWSIVAASN